MYPATWSSKYYPSLPQSEWEYVNHICKLVDDFRFYVKQFRQALSLFSFCENYIYVVGDWQFVAARDASMTTWHFYRNLDAVRVQMSHCPNFRSLVDLEQIKSIGKLFNETFPNCELLRDSVAHSADLKKSAKDQKNNSATNVNKFGVKTAKGAFIYVSDSVVGDDFIQTIKGQMVSLSISPASLRALQTMQEQLKILFESAVAKAAKYPE